jgi:sugar-specific transcriptional regulator TrmB
MADFQHKNVIDDLKALGLSDHEAEIYIIVLKHGEAPAGVILDEINLHREQVYRALKRMVDSGILNQYEKRKRNYYTAIDPSIFVKKTKAKLETARSLLPYLKELHQKMPQTIRVFEGKDAIRSLFDDIETSLKKGEEYLVLAGTWKGIYRVAGDVLPKYHKRFRKKGIGIRIVSYKGHDAAKELRFGDHIKVREISEPYANVVSTIIYKNKIAIEILDPENIAVILIENKKVADLHRQTFETLWKLGKEVRL